MRTSSLEKGAELLTLIARRFGILNALYPWKESFLGELASELKQDIGNISRYVTELEENGLVKIREEQQAKGRPRKYIKLTSECEDILHSFDNLVKPTEEMELFEPDPGEVDFLLKKVRDPLSEEVLKMGLEELKEIASRTRIWRYEFPSPGSLKEDGIWNFISNSLGREEWRRVLQILLITLRNAQKEGEEEVIERLGKIYAEDLREKARKDPYCYEVLDIVLSDEERWKLYTNHFEDLIRKENVRDYSSSIKQLERRMEKFWESDRKKCRNWFYSLMSRQRSKSERKSQELLRKYQEI